MAIQSLKDSRSPIGNTLHGIQHAFLVESAKIGWNARRIHPVMAERYGETLFRYVLA